MNYFAKLRSSPRFREKHEKTYIMPTLYGVAFGFVCLLLFGIGFASTNNAVYFLCFFMVALGSQSLILTNRITDKVKITQTAAEDFFADETGRLRLALHNPTQEDLQSLQFSLSKESVLEVERLRAGEHRDISVPLFMKEPGIYKLPRLSVSSDFPYHFSRSWKKHNIEVSVCVFPARRGSPQFAAAAYTSRNAESLNLDDFKGHREYQKSDSPRSIDWKVTARVQEVMVKEYDPLTSRKLTLRWEDCTQASEADKKSQLSLWIDLAEKNNFEYALELPSRHIGFSRGPQHRGECLRALL